MSGLCDSGMFPVTDNCAKINYEQKISVHGQHPYLPIQLPGAFDDFLHKT